MKRAALGLLTSAVVLASCLQKESPVEYNDRIVARMDGAIQAISGLEATFELAEPEKMDSAYRELIISLTESLQGVDSIGLFGEDSLLNAAAESSLKGHLEVAQELYPEYIALLKAPDSLFTSEQQTLAFQLKEQIDTKNAEVLQSFKKAQLAYGQAYKIVFEE